MVRRRGLLVERGLRTAVRNAFGRHSPRAGRDKRSIATETHSLLPKLRAGIGGIDLPLSVPGNVDIANRTAARDVSRVLRNADLIRAWGESNARGKRYGNPECASRFSSVLQSVVVNH